MVSWSVEYSKRRYKGRNIPDRAQLQNHYLFSESPNPWFKRNGSSHEYPSNNRNNLDEIRYTYMYIRKTREYTYEKINLKAYTQWSVVAFGHSWLSTKTSKVDTDTTHKNLCSNDGHLSNLGCYNNRDKKWHHTYRASVPNNRSRGNTMSNIILVKKTR